MTIPTFAWFGVHGERIPTSFNAMLRANPHRGMDKVKAVRITTRSAV
jgi:hypothetical protein